MHPNALHPGYSRDFIYLYGDAAAPVKTKPAEVRVHDIRLHIGDRTVFGRYLVNAQDFDGVGDTIRLGTLSGTDVELCLKSGPNYGCVVQLDQRVAYSWTYTAVTDAYGLTGYQVTEFVHNGERYVVEHRVRVRS